MSIYEMAKDAFKLAQKSDNVELIQKILDVQQQAVAQQDEVMRLRAENASLREQLNEVGVVEVYHGLYWKRLPDGLLDGPFSQARWDQDRKLVRLTYTDTYHESAVHRFYCGAAEYTYSVPITFYTRERIKNSDELPKSAPEQPRPIQERRGWMDGYGSR